MNETTIKKIESVLHRMESIEENFKGLQSELKDILAPSEPKENVKKLFPIDYITRMLESLALSTSFVGEDKLQELYQKVSKGLYFFNVDFGEKLYYFIRNSSPADYQYCIIDILESHNGIDSLNVAILQHLFTEIHLTENILEMLQKNHLLLELCTDERIKEIAKFIMNRDMECELFSERFVSIKIYSVDVFNTTYNIFYGYK